MKWQTLMQERIFAGGNNSGAQTGLIMQLSLL